VRQRNPSLSTAFLLGPDTHLTAVLDFDVHEIWPAADGTVLDVFLALSRREIDRDDDFFAAGLADVAGFIVHRLPLMESARCNVRDRVKQSKSAFTIQPLGYGFKSKAIEAGVKRGNRAICEIDGFAP